MTDGAPTLGVLLAHVRRALQDVSIPEAALEARLLVEHFTGTSRVDTILDPGRVVAPEQVKVVQAALSRRLAGEPVHRIIGSRDFHGMTLKLSPGTLEPRPDTETLVDLALPFVCAAADRLGFCRILDLGTGTGAIALALLKEELRAEAVGADISGDALATAVANADMTGNAARFRAVRSDWYSAIEGQFQVIVSNPPYIASRDIPMLEREVRDHDPLAALDGGPDGLDAYRTIANGALDHLAEDGMAAVEIGYGQREAVTAIFEGANLRLARCSKDLNGHDRALAFVRQDAFDAAQKTLGKAVYCS